ncbi:unnamed protein product [Linum tenue]|uniref:Uncharacterized protein n=1 Tax=Linum tenue TaxID=586396 RepID=A0AAV0JCL4_9ROSI|nr:unnamed protein product [Linum tenue]
MGMMFVESWVINQCGLECRIMEAAICFKSCKVGRLGFFFYNLIGNMVISEICRERGAGGCTEEDVCNV